MIRRRRLATLLPLTFLLSPAPLASAYGREVAAAQTTVLDLEREYQADQSSLREAFEPPARRPTSIDSNNWRRMVAGTPAKVRFCAARSPPEGRIPAAAKRGARLARETLLREEAAGGDRAAAAVLPDHPRLGNSPARRWGVPDGRAAAGKLADLAGTVKQVHEQLSKPGGKPVSPAIALRAARAVHDLQEVLKRWYSFYDGYLPDFTWWLKKPYDDSSKSSTSMPSISARRSPTSRARKKTRWSASPSGPRPWPPASATSGCLTRPMS